jgi:hypothetical protein
MGSRSGKLHNLKDEEYFPSFVLTVVGHENFDFEHKLWEVGSGKIPNFK